MVTSRLGALADHAAAMAGWRRWFAAFGCGLIFALAQPPLGLWPLIFVAGPILFWLWRGARGRSAFGVGLAFGEGYFGLGLHWIVEPFLVEPEVLGWLAPPALVTFAFGLGLFPAAGFWAAAAARDRGVAGAPALILGWGGMELARSFVLTGFPWALPAYVWTDTPVAQVASLVGPYALSLLTVAAAIGVGSATIWRRAPLGAVVVGLCLAWGWGSARIGPADIAGQPVIRIIQPNISQATKWDIDLIRPHFETTLALTARPYEGEAATVVVWPESAVTFPVDMADIARQEIAIAAAGAEVALGSLRVNGGPERADQTPLRWRNSFFLMDRNAELSAPFDKMHLVPFGEYLPFEDIVRSLGVTALAQRGAGIVPGDAPVIMRPAGAAPFAPLICYEMIFPREVAAAAEGADWLALATNDAWFGDWAGPIQHLAQAQFRAIETGLPIARSANTGISAMVDPYGRIVKSLTMNTEGVIDTYLPKPVSTTYRSIGESGAAILVLIIFCAALYSKRAKYDVAAH